jgi:hypothetical protein
MIHSKLICMGAAMIALAGCAGQPAVPFAASKTLVLEQDLVGRLAGDGTIINAVTGARTKFNVVINGAWDGKLLTLVETFTYEDGRKEQKTWHLTKVSQGQYRGTRTDVIGTAKVYQDGHAVRLNYLLAVDTGLGNLALYFRDLLSLQDNGSIENRAVASKFGLRLARVVLTLHRVP